MNPDKIRTFIAIELDEEVRRRIQEIQDSLRKTDADIRWVNPKNIHLTLKFIGDVPTEQIEKLSSAIEEGVKNFSRFEFQFDHLGWFPAKGLPRVLWIGINLGSDCLEKIESSLSAHVSSFCEKKENEKFSAHITLGRVKSTHSTRLGLKPEACSGLILSGAFEPRPEGRGLAPSNVSNKNIKNLVPLLKESAYHISEKQIVDHVTLFKSDLTSSGPIHSVIKNFNLK